jgi:cysteinyl-tRNA synthetase
MAVFETMANRFADVFGIVDVKNFMQWRNVHASTFYRVRTRLPHFLSLLPALLMTLGSDRADLSAGQMQTNPACSMAYVLQADELAANRIDAVDLLARSGRDVIVIDRGFDGPTDAWSIPELESIRRAKPGRKILAYLSIGEAEDYRSYWQPTWGFGADGIARASSPDFLVAPNPDWPGNYKVRYWDRRWQALILRDLERIIGQSFDGVYLDIVDAFQYFEYDRNSDDWLAMRINSQTGRSYREDMVRWVVRLADYARVRQQGFVVVPQNGSALVNHADYLAIIDAVAVEDLVSVDERVQSQEHMQTVLSELAFVRAENKPVFVIEYSSTKKLIAQALAIGRREQYSVLITDRPLAGLGRSEGQSSCTFARKKQLSK